MNIGLTSSKQERQKQPDLILRLNKIQEIPSTLGWYFSGLLFHCRLIEFRISSLSDRRYSAMDANRCRSSGLRYGDGKLGILFLIQKFEQVLGLMLRHQVTKRTGEPMAVVETDLTINKFDEIRKTLGGNFLNPRPPWNLETGG